MEKWELKLPAAQGFGHIFQPVSAHLDQNKAGLEKQAKILNMSTISDVFQNRNVRKNHLKMRPWFLKTKGYFLFELKKGCVWFKTLRYFYKKEIMYPKKMKRHFELGINGSHKYCSAWRTEGTHFHNRTEEKAENTIFKAFRFTAAKTFAAIWTVSDGGVNIFARSLNSSLRLSVLCVLLPVNLNSAFFWDTFKKHCQRHNGPRNWLRDLD